VEEEEDPDTKTADLCGLNADSCRQFYVSATVRVLSAKVRVSIKKGLLVKSRFGQKRISLQLPKTFSKVIVATPKGMNIAHHCQLLILYPVTKLIPIPRSMPATKRTKLGIYVPFINVNEPSFY